MTLPERLALMPKEVERVSAVIGRNWHNLQGEPDKAREACKWFTTGGDFHYFDPEFLAFLTVKIGEQILQLDGWNETTASYKDEFVHKFITHFKIGHSDTQEWIKVGAIEQCRHALVACDPDEGRFIWPWITCVFLEYSDSSRLEPLNKAVYLLLSQHAIHARNASGFRALAALLGTAEEKGGFYIEPSVQLLNDIVTVAMLLEIKDGFKPTKSLVTDLVAELYPSNPQSAATLAKVCKPLSSFFQEDRKGPRLDNTDREKMRREALTFLKKVLRSPLSL